MLKHNDAPFLDFPSASGQFHVGKHIPCENRTRGIDFFSAGTV